MNRLGSTDGGAAPAPECWSLLADVSEAQLRKLCRKRGLDFDGDKHALLARYPMTPACYLFLVRFEVMMR